MQVNDIDVFVAGVIQGSERGDGIAPQDYRSRLRAVVEACCPGMTIYDPVAHHPGSVAYDLERARATFYDHVELVTRSRCILAYLPEASMGTAIEMWEARERGIPVVTISPMRDNWVVRILSSARFDDIAAFEAWARAGKLEALVRGRRRGAPDEVRG